MEGEVQEGSARPAAEAGVAATDGQIDFSPYSLQQLRDFASTIDPSVFPRNYENLQRALYERSVPAASPPARHAVRLTKHDGWLGWLEAKLHRSPLYGAGFLDIANGELAVEASQRTWLGTATEATRRWPISQLLTFGPVGSDLYIEWFRRWWPLQRLRLRCTDVRQAKEIAQALLADAACALPSGVVTQREFNLRLQNERRGVWVTAALVLANVLIYVAMVARRSGETAFNLAYLLESGANLGSLTASGQWWRLLSALFLHSEPLHLLLNMWALWNVGRMTERLYGHGTFLALYVVCGALASFSTIVWNPTTASVGASGAIFGIIGAFLAYLARPSMGVPRVLVRSHWISTCVFVLFNLINGFLRPGIDNAAHLGGLASGLILGAIVARPVGAPQGSTRLVAAGAAAAVMLLACLWQAQIIGRELTAPEQFWRGHDWYLQGEATNVGAWKDLLARINSGYSSDVEINGRLKRDILPFWEQADGRLSHEPPAPSAAVRSFATLIGTFVQAREHWVHMAIHATESHDRLAKEAVEAAAKQTTALQAQIERVVLRANYDSRRRGLSDSAPMHLLRNLLSGRLHTCVVAPARRHSPVSEHDAREDAPARRAALACRAQGLFMQGDYQALEQTLRNELAHLEDLPDGDSSLEASFGGLKTLFEYGALTPDVLFGHLADWRRTVPGSIAAELAEIAAFDSLAWTARGGGTADTVSQVGWNLYAYRVSMAAAGVTELARRAVDWPLYYELALRIGLDKSVKRSMLEAIYTAGVARFPTHAEIDYDMLRIVMPRWKGSFDDVERIVNQAYGRSPGNYGFERYARLYWQYAYLEGDDTDLFQESRATWSDVRKGFEDMRRVFPQSDYIVNGYAYMACRARDAASYASLRQVLTARFSASAWTAKYSKTDCDAKMLAPVAGSTHAP